MIQIVASPNAARASAAYRRGGFGIALYHAGTDAIAGIGHTLPHAVESDLPCPPPVLAWDFLSVALAVFGVDRFLLRRTSPDGWTRQIALEVDVSEPDPWNAVSERLGSILRFLSGDIWSIRFHAGGMRPPNWHPKLTDRDCVCLFSGGLDSFIGASDLLKRKRRPLLVSQASPKEGTVQQYLAGRLGLDAHRFEGKTIERHGLVYEPSSRARSILFLGYGIVAATSIQRRASPTLLVVPENGLISLNPPLTRRRVGSASTRTTHPYFMTELEGILHDVGLSVDLRNPYSGMTKGEMLADCKSEIVSKFAHYTYSCGKGKRLNQHCGRCIPCLIRRAAFKGAGLKDRTDYWAQNLKEHAKNDDVFAARLAVEQLLHRNIGRWTSEAGPLPDDLKERAIFHNVVRRGLGELKDFIDDVRWS